MAAKASKPPFFEFPYYVTYKMVLLFQPFKTNPIRRRSSLVTYSSIYLLPFINATRFIYGQSLPLKRQIPGNRLLPALI